MSRFVNLSTIRGDVDEAKRHGDFVALCDAVDQLVKHAQQIEEEIDRLKSEIDDLPQR